MVTGRTSASKRIIAVPVIVIIVITIMGFGLLALGLNKMAVIRYETNLMTLAGSGAQTVKLLPGNATVEDFDRFADAFAENSGYWVTIFDTNGVVLGDSQLSVQEIHRIELDAESPELVRARESRVGIARRHSDTLKTDLLLVAVRYSGPDHKGYFRVAAPLSELHEEQVRERALIGIFSLVALLIAVIFSLLASRYLLSLVDRSREYLERRLTEASQQIDILRNLITQLTACSNVEEVMQVIRLVTSMLLPRFSGALALSKSSKDQLKIVENWNGQWDGASSYGPDECWALRTGKPHMSNLRAGTITCGHSQDHPGKMLCIPLIAQGETRGVIHFSSPVETEWTDGEQKFAAAVAEHISLTLANLQLRESLRNQAIRDPLTGLYNRRYLMETIEHEFSQARRKERPFGLLMIDLDYFKRFNDDYGHDTGDFVLSEFGRLVKLVTRKEDIACRYGGEEFIVLLPDTGYEGTRQVAAKVMSTIREHDFIFNNRSHGPITVSIGAVNFPAYGESPEDLLRQADSALYEAKRGGRDRVIFVGEDI